CLQLTDVCSKANDLGLQGLLLRLQPERRLDERRALLGGEAIPRSLGRYLGRDQEPEHEQGDRERDLDARQPTQATKEAAHGASTSRGSSSGVGVSGSAGWSGSAGSGARGGSGFSGGRNGSPRLIRLATTTRPATIRNPNSPRPTYSSTPLPEPPGSEGPAGGAVATGPDAPGPGVGTGAAPQPGGSGPGGAGCGP